MVALPRYLLSTNNFLETHSIFLVQIVSVIKKDAIFLFVHSGADAGDGL